MVDSGVEEKVGDVRIGLSSCRQAEGSLPDYFPEFDRRIDQVLLSSQFAPALTQLTDQGFLNYRGDRTDPRFFSYGMTTFLSDLIAWGQKQAEPAQALSLIVRKAKLTSEQKAVLQEGFQSFALVLDDLVDKIDLSHDERNLSEESKVEWAKFNQKISLAFFLASEKPLNHPDRINIELFAAMIATISSFALTRRMRLSDEASANYSRGILNGARAQSGLMGILKKNGYLVIVPDWEDDQEIREFELKGVDLVAINKNGAVLLIDAKGRAKTDKGQERVITETRTLDYRSRDYDTIKERIFSYLQTGPDLPGYEGHVQKACAAHDNLAACQVILPTGEDSMDSLGRVNAHIESTVINFIKQECPKDYRK